MLKTKQMRKAIIELRKLGFNKISESRHSISISNESHNIIFTDVGDVYWDGLGKSWIEWKYIPKEVVKVIIYLIEERNGR